MGIRVENDQIGSAASIPAGRVDQISAAPEGTSKSSSAANQGPDQIDVSPFTARISSELSAQSSAREARVQQLGALYAGGQYTVDSGQISRFLVVGSIGNTAGNAGGNADAGTL